jgi:hypothetical protein
MFLGRGPGRSLPTPRNRLDDLLAQDDPSRQNTNADRNCPVAPGLGDPLDQLLAAQLDAFRRRQRFRFSRRINQPTALN